MAESFIIDAHHHLWQYSPEEYGWIDENMEVIARDFTAETLAAGVAPLGVTGTIAVQARQTLAETHALLDIAQQHPLVQGVVGWVPLVEPSVGQTLDALLSTGKLKGIRHVVQDEPDDDFILGEKFNQGVRAVLQRNLVYDILIFARHLPQAIAFVDTHPTGQFVLDHIAKPEIADGKQEPWASNLKKLAERSNVSCKLSGVVTEADWADWSLDSIWFYLDTALEAFGAERLMFGSDWPVCLLATGYERWLRTVQEWAEPLSQAERSALFGGVAARVYQLSTE